MSSHSFVMKEVIGNGRGTKIMMSCKRGAISKNFPSSSGIELGVFSLTHKGPISLDRHVKAFLISIMY